MSTTVKYGSETTIIDINQLDNAEDNPVINGIKELLRDRINQVSISYTRCKEAVDESINGIPPFRDKTKVYKEKIKREVEETKTENDQTTEVHFLNIPGHIRGFFTRMANNRTASNNCQVCFVEIKSTFQILENSMKSIDKRMAEIMYRSESLGGVLQMCFPDLKNKYHYNDPKNLGWAYFYMIEVNPSEIQSNSNKDGDILMLTQKLLENNPRVRRTFDDLYEGAGTFFEMFLQLLKTLASAVGNIAMYLPDITYNFIVSLRCPGSQYLEKIDEIMKKIDESEGKLKIVRGKLEAKNWN